MLNCTMIYTCITGSVISSLINRSLRFHERCKTVPVSAAGFPGFGNMLCKLLQGKRQICHGLAVLSVQLCAAAIPVFMERGFLPAVAGAFYKMKYVFGEMMGLPFLVAADRGAFLGIQEQISAGRP